MSILQEILNWSHVLPKWQSDSIARLFSKGTLSNDDLDDLFALLKAEHGIPDPKNRKSVKLSSDQIPISTQKDTQIKILGLKNLQHVNALANNQRLPFCSSGLTLIYGDNGAGKSGYVRVFKCVCRARDQNEPIYPNAFLPPSQTSVASAIFEVEVNGKPDELSWLNGKPAPEILSSIAVFDSRCARSYLDEEGDFAYVPYGLDILEELAVVCKKLKIMIENEQLQYIPDTSSFDNLIGDTVVGKLISKLSHQTKSEQVETLASLTPEEEERRHNLEKNLKEQSPKEKAIQLRSCASRITKVALSAVQKLEKLDNAAVTKLRKLVEAHIIAQESVTLAAQQFKVDAGFLPGTGSTAWKELFLAARAFTIEAYPGKHIHELGSAENCPLCQQPLDEGATRLKIFEEFIQQDVEKTAKIRKKELDDTYKIFSTESMSLGMDDELFSEIDSFVKNLASDIRSFEAALITRHESIKAVVKSQNWDTIDNIPDSPAVRLQNLADKLIQDAETLEKLMDEKIRATLQIEFNELEARMQLAKVKAAILIAIQRLDRQYKLKSCLSAIKTNTISLKAAELTEKVVSQELEKALNNEFKILGVGNLQVSLKSRSEKGKAYHKLKLNIPQAKAPIDILSEGEQRAIAIGAFLAEVNIGGSSNGIIFDDPVSSLDHKRRERFARRIAQEALKRQVIVFTHDIYFLNLLTDEAEKAGVCIAKQSVVHRAEGFGVADPDLPFEGMNTKERIGYLRDRQQNINKVYNTGDEVEHRKLTADAYRQLRFAWERAVEEVLLCNVVLRFRKGIETQRLKGVSVEDNDYFIIDRSMSKCSNYAHDQALLGGCEVPDPVELLTDINELDEWRKNVFERGVQIGKKRKSAGH
jgi:energy-coupling factor transporter ATP-binding protein EcfA2